MKKAITKKIVKCIFVFVLSISMIIVLSSCANNTNNNNNECKVTLTSEKSTLPIGEEMQVFASSNKIGNFIYESSDNTIASVDEDGYVKAKKVGNVIITAYLESYPDIKATLDLTIGGAEIKSVKIVGTKAGKIGDVITLSYSVSPRGIDVIGTYENLNPELITLKQTNNQAEITLLNEGVATINIHFNDASNFNYTFNVGICSYDDLIVDSKKVAEEGDIIEYNGKTYYYGFTYLASLKDAFLNVNENGKILVLEGNYEKDAVLKANNVTILGLNSETNPVKTDFVKHAVVRNSIVIEKNVTGTIIRGLTFTENGNLYLNGNNDNTTIANNYFDQCKTTQTWRKQCSDACIYLDSDTNSFDSITITQNKFNKINNYGIAFNYANSIKITDNEFLDFELDAIHANGTEVLDSCQWLIRNNVMKNGGYNGIYFYGYGPKVVSFDNMISIFDNKFINIGNNNTDNAYYGAINLDNFNGGTCSITVRYNEFINCLGNINIDSATDDRYVKNISVNVNYNLFSADNVNYYYTNKTDSVVYEENSIANFDYNTYVKSDLKTIIDPTNKVIGVSSLKNNIKVEDFNNLNKIYGSNTLYKEGQSKFIVEGKEVTWKSTDTSIVTIDKDGLAKAIDLGDAKILAYSGSNLLGSYDVTVKDAINIDYATLLVQIALKEEGYREGSNNYTKYGVWYGKTHGKEYENGAWCAMFVSWCANQANIPTTIIPEYALVSAGRQWFEQRGLFRYKEDYTPKTGDLIFFLSNGASHTGIVVEYKNGTVYTIEGNTSDMCAQRNYNPMKATITGYGLPQYPKYTGNKIVEFDVSSSTDGSDHKTT